MSVIVEAIRVSSTTFRPETVPHLIGNILEPVNIEIDCRFELYVQASTGQPIEAGFNVPNVITQDWLFDGGLTGRFNDFQIGDTLTITNGGANNGSYTVTEKNGPNYIRLDSVLVDASMTGALVTNTTSIGGMTFKTAFIENNEGLNFDSKETLDAQVWTSDELDATNPAYVSCEGQGNIEWQAGIVQVKGQNVGNESFTILISTWIHPFFLAGQIADLQAGIAPSYYLSNACLKHVFEIGLQPSLRNPNRIYTITVDDVLGNTGWFDENFNGLPTNYFIDSVAFEKVSDASPLTALELTGADQTKVTVVVKNTVDSPFIDHGVDPVNATDFIVSFCFLPSETSLYRNTGKKLIDNFYFDNAINQAGNPALVSGFRGGGGYQVITQMTSTFVSASEISITFNVDLGADVLNGLILANERNYLLAVSTQDSSLALNVSDRVQLLANTDQFIYDPTNSDSVTFSNKFLIHPQNAISDSQIDSLFLPEDNVVGTTILQLDNSLGELLTGVSVDVLAVKNTGEEFTLESFDQQIPTNVIVNNAQFFDINIPKSTKIPSGQIRNNIVIKRRTDLDSAPVYAFELTYPYTIRWEDWVALANVNSDFYDALELNDGFNQEWNRYNVPVDWQVCYRVTATIQQDDIIYQSFQDYFVDTNDYGENADWINKTVKTFDPDTLAQLTSGGTDFVLGYKDTKVEVEFEWAGAGTAPSLADVWFVIRMEVFQAGGINGITMLSNIYDTDGNSFLKSSDPATDPLRVKVTETAGVYKGECLVDFTQLPVGETEYKISGRIGQITDPNCLLTEDGQPINVEDDSDCLRIES